MPRVISLTGHTQLPALGFRGRASGVKAGSERTVPLAAEAVEALRQHRRRQLEERLALGERWVEDRLIFASEIGSALDHNVWVEGCEISGWRSPMAQVCPVSSLTGKGKK